jgi:cytochrome c oxidase subunit 3
VGRRHRKARQGDHTPVVRIGLRYGFIMFIMSEVMFFAAWFWSFFKHAIYPMTPHSPASTSGRRRDRDLRPLAPAADQHADPALSGCAVTWAHHALVHDEQPQGRWNGA